MSIGLTNNMPYNSPQSTEVKWQPQNHGQVFADALLSKGHARPVKPLTKKQKSFAIGIIENPKLSATEIAARVYNVNNRNTARSIAAENLSKPAILAELAKYSVNSELTLLRVMDYSTEYGAEGGKEGASYASVAMQTANSILDRLHGKATTKIEQTTTAVTLNIDLTNSI